MVMTSQQICILWVLRSRARPKKENIFLKNQLVYKFSYYRPERQTYKQINMINMVMINTPSKDARLPVQLQRAMAAEAEAAREARAKVGFNMVYRVGDGMVKIWPG